MLLVSPFKKDYDKVVWKTYLLPLSKSRPSCTLNSQPTDSIPSHTLSTVHSSAFILMFLYSKVIVRLNSNSFQFLNTWLLCQLLHFLAVTMSKIVNISNLQLLFWKNRDKDTYYKELKAVNWGNVCKIFWILILSKCPIPFSWYSVSSVIWLKVIPPVSLSITPLQKSDVLLSDYCWTISNNIFDQKVRFFIKAIFNGLLHFSIFRRMKTSVKFISNYIIEVIEKSGFI